MAIVVTDNKDRVQFDEGQIVIEKDKVNKTATAYVDVEVGEVKDDKRIPLGGDTSELEEAVETLETQVGDMFFRVHEDKPQYKDGATGEWKDFSSGGGVATLITTLTQGNIYAWDNINVNSAGYSHLLIECCHNDSWTNSTICIAQKNVPTALCCYRDGGVTFRYVKVTDTQIMGQGFLTDSYRCIPHRVWGVNIAYA